MTEAEIGGLLRDALMVALGLKAADPSLSTGYPTLDRQSGGLPKPGLTIVGARPARGKTALCLNIAHNVAKAGGLAAYFSLEMNRRLLAERRLAMEARVDSRHIRAGTLDPEEQDRVAEAAKRLESYRPLLVDDASGLSVAQISARVRRAHVRSPLDLVVVDYLQLINDRKDRNETRAQAIGRVSKALLALSKDLNIPVIGVSQLSRASEMRADKRPTLADLRESGELEQDAEQVMLLHIQEDAPTVLEVSIAKNRNGAADQIVRLAFTKEFQRIDTLEWKAPPAAQGASPQPGQQRNRQRGGRWEQVPVTE
jgi:replicative DNA helicase